jgi:hypothetical protein
MAANTSIIDSDPVLISVSNWAADCSTHRAFPVNNTYSWAGWNANFQNVCYVQKMFLPVNIVLLLIPFAVLFLAKILYR